MTLHYTATAEDNGKKLFSILRYRLHLSAGLIKRLKHQTLMYVNGTPVYTNHIIAPGNKITLPLPEERADFPPEPGPSSPSTSLPVSSFILPPPEIPVHWRIVCWPILAAARCTR